MEKEFFDLLGLGVPFYLAAATYAVFAWLDSNASDDATKVISSWLHGRSHNESDLGNLLLKAFDRVYTRPVYAFRAFRRSAVISTVIWLLIFYIPFAVEAIPPQAQLASSLILKPGPAHFKSISLLISTVLSDYMSLSSVRRVLVWRRSHPIRASLSATIKGAAVTFATFTLFIMMTLLLAYSTDPQLFTNLVHGTPHPAPFEVIKSMLVLLILIIRPALVIYLWLPLFALSSLLLRMVFWIFRAVEKAQWFLKQGDEHPLKAIGIVATIIVFGSAMLVKEGWALLGVLEDSIW
jgi:hypothetical protein